MLQLEPLELNLPARIPIGLTRTYEVNFKSHHGLIRLLLPLLGVCCPVFPSREQGALDSLFEVTTKSHTGWYCSQLPVIYRFIYLSGFSVYSEEFLGGSIHLH